jgi:arylsulfatase A-like enzyme
MATRVAFVCGLFFMVQATPPNIIWIMADDLGYGELSSFGQTNFQTHNIDRFAEEGIRFTSAYCGAPLCAPSRASFMTGLHTGHTNIRGNGKKGPGQTDTPLRDNDTTVAELLQLAGYYTAIVGKWGLGVPSSSGSPQLKGFDYFYGEPDQQNAHNYYPPYLYQTSNSSSDLQKVILSGNVFGEISGAPVLPSIAFNPDSRRCLDVSNGDNADVGDVVILNMCPSDSVEVECMMWTLDQQTGLLYNENNIVLGRDRAVESVLLCVSASDGSGYPSLQQCDADNAYQKWSLTNHNFLQLAHTEQCLGYATDAVGRRQAIIPLKLVSCALLSSDNESTAYRPASLHFNQDPPSRLRCMSPITDTYGNHGGCRYTHDLFTAAALDMVTQRTKRAPSQPFFLYLAWADPHAGGWSTDDIEAGNPVPSDGEFSQQASWPVVERDHASVIQNYLDRDVGRLVQTLQQLGIDNNTVVFFASDNGASNEGGHKGSFFVSSGPLKGYKRSLYEGGIRTPSSVRWPGHIKPGQTVHFPWYFPDFLPTALDIAGRIDLIPAVTDGVSILPLLLGDSEVTRPVDTCIYFEFCTNNKWGRAARMNQWKAVGLSSELPTELYDLSVDVGEERDVAGLFPDVVRELQTCMDAQHEENSDWPRGDARCGKNPEASPGPEAGGPSSDSPDLSTGRKSMEPTLTPVSKSVAGTKNAQEMYISFVVKVMRVMKEGLQLTILLGGVAATLFGCRRMFSYSSASGRRHSGHQVLSQVDDDDYDNDNNDDTFL